MKTYNVEYKTLAYFIAKIKANSKEEAEEIAKKLDKEDFALYDTLDCDWRFSQTTEGA